MHILIIGGTKSMGPHVVNELVERGHTVTVYHRGETESKLPDSVRHVHSPDAAMPVTNFPREVLDPGPTVVIHMIPMGESDMRAAIETFRGHAERIVAISSGDVYLAYGRFTGLEPGPAEQGLLEESSQLRTVLYPYRKQAQSPKDWVYSYEKILVENVALSDPALPAVVLRLPKVYGPNDNASLATMYGFRQHPRWRWTHGYVENVAHAIVLAAIHPNAAGRIYNVGERHTPTVAERLAMLPASSIGDIETPANFDQDIVYDTSRIRRELQYDEVVEYTEGLRRTLGAILSL